MARTDPKYRRLILRAMAEMASADGEIDSGEVAAIRSVYAREAGEEISADDIAKTVESFQACRSTLASELSAASAEMDRTTKEFLLRTCYLVLLADGRVAARERKKLQDFADALNIPEIHLCAILEDVSG